MPPPADAGPGSSFITGRAMQSAGLIDGSVGSICAAGAAHEHSQVLTRIGLSALIQGIPGFMYSRVQNTGTPAVTGSPAVHALRSLILLYMYIPRSIDIGILTTFSGILLVPADLLLAAGAVHTLHPATLLPLLPSSGSSSSQTEVPPLQAR